MSDQYVALMGTKGGPAIRPGSTMPTSSLVCLNGRKIVVDCGLGVARGLIDQGMQLSDLSLIIITHLHSDHYLELGPLIHTAWTAGLKTKVDVYGPAGLDDYWTAFLDSMKRDIDLRIADEGRPDLTGLVDIHVMDEGHVLTKDGITLTAMRNEHPPLVDTFALKFQTDTHNIVFSGDTAYLPTLIDFAKDADLLVHEAMLEHALDALAKRVGNSDDRLMKHFLRAHTTAEYAAHIAAKAGVKALAFHHLIPSDDPDYTAADWHQAIASNYGGVFHLGRDGLRIDLA